MLLQTQRVLYVFFFKQKTAYEMRISDWSSDVCSSDLFRGRGGRDRELTIPELVRTGGDIREPEEFRRASIANFNHRMVQVAAMFALPLLALSLAIPPKRSTSALGVFLSIVIIVTYHKINEYAEQMGALGRIRSEEHTSELQSLMRNSYAV